MASGLSLLWEPWRATTFLNQVLVMHARSPSSSRTRSQIADYFTQSSLAFVKGTFRPTEWTQIIGFCKLEQGKFRTCLNCLHLFYIRISAQCPPTLRHIIKQCLFQEPVNPSWRRFSTSIFCPQLLRLFKGTTFGILLPLALSSEERSPGLAQK